jgi:hypothetical protein
MMALAAIFGNVQAGGTLSLTAGSDPDVASGTETISSLHLEHQTDELDVSMSELLGGAVSVAAGFGGIATGPTSMSFSQHEFELRFGVLVQIAARELLGIDANALGQQAMDAVDCAEIVDLVTGGEASYSITVGGQGFSVTAAQLTTACGDLRTELTDEALGMIRPDAGLRLGGPVGFSGSGTASGVASSAGYGGAITALSFGPVEPQVTSTLSATR